jgi:hypothetical protein
VRQARSGRGRLPQRGTSSTPIRWGFSSSSAYQAASASVVPCAMSRIEPPPADEADPAQPVQRLLARSLGAVGMVTWIQRLAVLAAVGSTGVACASLLGLDSGIGLDDDAGGSAVDGSQDVGTSGESSREGNAVADPDGEACECSGSASGSGSGSSPGGDAGSGSGGSGSGSSGSSGSASGGSGSGSGGGSSASTSSSSGSDGGCVGPHLDCSNNCCTGLVCVLGVCVSP